MTVVAPRTSRARRSRWAALLASVAFHAAVLGALSLGLPSFAPRAEPSAMNVALVDAPPFVRPQLSPSAPKPKPPVTRLAVLDTPPRYAQAQVQAATGEASDAVDLFGPVFSDGLWPRPLVVKSEPCDSKGASEPADTCRRELLMIGLASGSVAEANSPP